MITYNSTYVKKLSKDVSEVEKIAYEIPESFVKDGIVYTYQANSVKYADRTNSEFISVKDYLLENLKDRCKFSTEEVNSSNKTKFYFSSYEPLTKDVNIVKTTTYEIPNTIFRDGKFLSLDPSKSGYTDRYNKSFIGIKEFIISSLGKNPFQSPRKDANAHYRRCKVTYSKSKVLTSQIKEISEVTYEIPAAFTKDGKLYMYNNESRSYYTDGLNQPYTAKEFIRDSILENNKTSFAKQTSDFNL